MKVNRDGTMTLECSGRRIGGSEIAISDGQETSAADNDDGIGQALRISVVGYSTDRAWTYFDNQATDEEKRELAVHMMRRWAKYGGIDGDVIARCIHAKGHAGKCAF